MKKILALPFVQGMVKALDLSGTYACAGNPRSHSSADDLRTPDFRDDVRHLRRDFKRIGGDMRSALDKRQHA